MKVFCAICPDAPDFEADLPTPEKSAYAHHMAEVHGGSQKTGRFKQQNLPPLPPTVTPNDLPSDEFLKTVQEIDKVEKQAPPQIVPTPPVQEKPVVAHPGVSQAQKTAEIPLLKLKYVWIGNCPTCNTPVRTVMLQNGDKLFAIALCLTHDAVEQKEVVPLEETEKTLEKEIKDIVARKGAEKHGKTNVRSKPPVQNKVRPVPKTDPPSIQDGD